MRRSMRLLLQRHGINVRVYAAADPMLLDEERAEASSLVADYLLGGRNGISLLSVLQDQGWKGLPIFATAFLIKVLRHSAAKAGFSAFLEKSLRENALVNTVATLAARNIGGD